MKTPEGFWTAVAERSGDTAFTTTITTKSGVALRFPPQSKMAQASPNLEYNLLSHMQRKCVRRSGIDFNGRRDDCVISSVK